MMFSNREVVDTRAGTAVMEWQDRAALSTRAAYSPSPTQQSPVLPRLSTE